MSTTFTEFIKNLYPPFYEDHGVKCKRLSSFMYPNQPSSEVAAAKELCNGSANTDACPFRNECRKWAIDHGEAFGVWGGTSERERRKIQRARKKFSNPYIYSLEDVRFPQIVFIRSHPVTFLQRRASQIDDAPSLKAS